MMVKFNQNYMGWVQHQTYMVGMGHMIGQGQAELLVSRGIVRIVPADKPKRKRRKRAKSNATLRKNDNVDQSNG